MTLACGRVGSDATLLSGGGRRALAGPLAEPLAEPDAAPSALTPLEVERERIRIAQGFDSRACKYAIAVRYTYTYLPFDMVRVFAEISLHGDTSDIYHSSLPQTSVGQYKEDSCINAPY